MTAPRKKPATKKKPAPKKKGAPRKRGKAVLPPVTSLPDKKPGSQYSDRDKALALSTLDYHGGCVADATRYLRGLGWKITETSIRQWRNAGMGSNSFVQELRKGANQAITDGMERVLEVAIRRIYQKIPEATMYQLVGVVNVLSDKLQLLKDLPTSRVHHEHTTILEQFNAQLQLMMPNGDGSEDHSRERPQATEIIIQPADRPRLSHRTGSPSVDVEPGHPAPEKGARRKRDG